MSTIDMNRDCRRSHSNCIFNKWSDK